MARFSFIAFLFSALLVMLVSAAPTSLEARQKGDLQCNLNRFGIVSEIAAAKKTLNGVKSTDAATESAVKAAQAGLTTASNGIKNIGAAIQANANAGQADRDSVATGLEAAIAALKAVKPSAKDNATNKAIAKAEKQLAKAGNFGEQVVATCK